MKISDTERPHLLEGVHQLAVLLGRPIYFEQLDGPEK
jgi:hypothetical protein